MNGRIGGWRPADRRRAFGAACQKTLPRGPFDYALGVARAFPAIELKKISKKSGFLLAKT
jgi:hypothetical protein